jgi:serine protease
MSDIRSSPWSLRSARALALALGLSLLAGSPAGHTGQPFRGPESLRTPAGPQDRPTARQSISRNAKQALLNAPHAPAVSLDRPLAYDNLAHARAAERPLYVPSHIVLKVSSTMSAQALQALASSVGARAVRRPTWADFHYVTLEADADPVAAAAALAGQPGVIFAEPDAVVLPTFTPNDPFYEFQWHFHNLDMPSAWGINQGASSNVTVAVLDTGVAFRNLGPFTVAPDLAGTTFVSPWDFVWEDPDPVDMHGHGTHVTGTIAQTTNNNLGTAGIAFNARIMPVKVLFTDWDEELGAPFPHGASTVARGIRYAVDNGARVLNMSLGAFAPNTAVEDALRYAVGRGAFVAVSAGNDGNGQNRRSWPAAYATAIPGVVAVAALDFSNERAFYSTRHDYVTIAAPGGDLRVDRSGHGFADGVLQQTLRPEAVAAGVFNQYGFFFFQGTSMAAPHVAGLAALLMDQGITSPAAIEAALTRFARDLGTPGRNDETGHGVIRPRETLRGLGLAR